MKATDLDRILDGHFRQREVGGEISRAGGQYDTGDPLPVQLR